MQSHVRFNKVPEKVPDKYPDKVPGGFGAEPVHVQQGSGEGFGEGLGGFGAEPGQVQQGSAEYSGEGSRKRWCKAKSGSTGSGKVGETNAGEVHLTHGNLAEEFPALGFPARFRKIDKNKTLRLLGIPPKVFLGQFAPKNGPGLQKLLASTVPGELSASRQIRKNANTRSYTGNKKTNTRLITGKKLQTQLCLVNIFFHYSSINQVQV